MLSKALTLSALLVFGISSLHAQKLYSLSQLQADPNFEVSVVANGGYSEASVELLIKSTNNRDVKLGIPAGTVFFTSDDNHQILIIVEDEVFVIAKDKTKKKLLDAYCTEASDRVPNADMEMAFMPTKNEKLQKLASFINQNRGFEAHEIQEAVWCVSDGNPLSYIYAEDDEKTKKLTQFVADLTGQEVSWHQVKRSFSQIEEYIVPSPIHVSGEVKFETKKPITVYSKVIDQEGNILHERPNPVNVPILDEVRINFNITVVGWDPGMYYVIYYDQDGNTILKKEFEI